MATPAAHRDDAKAEPPMVKLTFLVPRSWREALNDAASAQGLTAASLLRLILGGFLRNRLPATGASS